MISYDQYDDNDYYNDDNEDDDDDANDGDDDDYLYYVNLKVQLPLHTLSPLQIIIFNTCVRSSQTSRSREAHFTETLQLHGIYPTFGQQNCSTKGHLKQLAMYMYYVGKFSNNLQWN